VHEGEEAVERRLGPNWVPSGQIMQCHIPRWTSLAGILSQQGVPEAGAVQSDMLVSKETLFVEQAKYVLGVWK
jgi:hypothetical protein